MSASAPFRTRAVQQKRLYSMTSSAATCNVCGTVTPSDFAGPKIDHQFKPCRLYNRQLSGFGAFEDLRCVDAYLAKPLGIVARIAGQPADLHKIALRDG